VGIITRKHCREKVSLALPEEGIEIWLKRKSILCIIISIIIIIIIIIMMMMMMMS